MKKCIIFLAVLAAVYGIGWATLEYLQNHVVAVMQPMGFVGIKERNLLVIATCLMLLVVIPVFILAIYFAYKYRASNKKAKYEPKWDYDLVAESIWWGFPCAIVLIIAVITFRSSHEHDPFKPIESDTKALNVQVVALQWNWLFIYPEYNIATLNYVQFPEKTPINFYVTADAPMNSFWIPRLGGQIYAMPGMKTQLHLIADTVGTFDGVSANLSGKGFAGMKFEAQASSDEDFHKWVASVQASANALDIDVYKQLAKPSENTPVTLYQLTKPDLYEWIVMKYMMPMPQN